MGQCVGKPRPKKRTGDPPVAARGRTSTPILQRKQVPAYTMPVSSPVEETMVSLQTPGAEEEQVIHQRLRLSEQQLWPRAEVLRHHPELTSAMRMVVVDWLVEVSAENLLCDETLHLAVCHLDHFLSLTKGVTSSDLQLVATAALMMACKPHETLPDPEELLQGPDDGASTRDKLTEMGVNILEVLDFQASVPATTAHFLTQYLSVEPVSSQTESFARYVSDLSLLSVEISARYVPSVVAAAAFCLANACLWPVSLEVFTGYDLSEFAPCVVALHRLYADAGKLPQWAIRCKYHHDEQEDGIGGLLEDLH